MLNVNHGHVSVLQMRKGARETVSGLEVWYKTIKGIEGKFGSGVATYFRFLRSLILLNAVVLLFRYLVVMSGMSFLVSYL